MAVITRNIYVIHRLTTLKLLIAHLHEAHGMLMENKNLTFSTFEEFQEWKCKEEKSTLFPTCNIVLHMCMVTTGIGTITATVWVNMKVGVRE